MKNSAYRSIPLPGQVNRRDFLKIGGAVGAGLVLGRPKLRAQEKKTPVRIATNIQDALNIPKTDRSLPGRFPGQVAKISDTRVAAGNGFDASVVRDMFTRGLRLLTGKNPRKSFRLLFDRDDVIGIKVNPVGPGLISTRPELVEAVIGWLLDNGMERSHIIIWDRFDYMLRDAGFTPERFPGIGIAGLQTMDEAAASGQSQDNSRWLDKDGNHVSTANFDQSVFYWADVEGPKDAAYLNQHVVNGKYSYFGSLLTKKLTKIINLPVFKNTGNGISMATKNIGYAAICNTGRLHKPLFFDVCTEVLAFPVIRDKLVLNVTDGLRGQYDGGPEPAASFIYPLNSLFLATDPFALDAVCHRLLVEKRKSMGVKVNEHPVYSEYLRYAEKLGLGVVDPARVAHRQLTLS